MNGKFPKENGPDFYFASCKLPIWTILFRWWDANTMHFDHKVLKHNALNATSMFITRRYVDNYRYAEIESSLSSFISCNDPAVELNALFLNKNSLMKSPIWSQPVCCIFWIGSCHLQKPNVQNWKISWTIPSTNKVWTNLFFINIF